MNYKEQLENSTSKTSVMILGYGQTGENLAQFCDEKSWNYFIADDHKTVERSSENFMGQWPSSEKALPENCHFVFHSPGVSLQHPLVEFAQKKTIPILSELELASYYTKGKRIGVTGTNGKSTTVLLINKLLNDAGLSSQAKGNIGDPFITAACSEAPLFDFTIIEESSYQLEFVSSLHHDIAICLNITEDHLEWHGDFEHYKNAKSKIIQNSRNSDTFVFNADDPACVSLAQQATARLLPFSLVNLSFQNGGHATQDRLVISLQDKKWEFLFDDLSLKGSHNQENILAALLATMSIDSSDEKVSSYRETLKTFKGLPHRMEFVCEQGGVAYYDDSKGTNINATVMALASFQDKPIVLIMGGVDKGGNYSPLKGMIHGKVKALIVMGENQSKLFEIFSEETKTVKAQNMKDAVALAKDNSETGDVVLLSPACASFDQYKNYKERGMDFQSCVKTMENLI